MAPGGLMIPVNIVANRKCRLPDGRFIWLGSLVSACGTLGTDRPLRAFPEMTQRSHGASVPADHMLIESPSLLIRLCRAVYCSHTGGLLRSGPSAFPLSFAVPERKMRSLLLLTCLVGFPPYLLAIALPSLSLLPRAHQPWTLCTNLPFNVAGL